MENERIEQRSPRELNKEFRDLLASAPSVQIAGTLKFDEPWHGVSDLKHNEFTDFRELVEEEYFRTHYEPVLYKGDFIYEAWSKIIEAKVLERKRLDFRYRADILLKLPPLLPFIKGTESFANFFIPRELRRLMIEGVSYAGQNHYLYGDEQGGIFNDDSVGEIEEHSFQVFEGDIRMLTTDYDIGTTYRWLVDMGRVWKPEFIDKYKRVPMNTRGEEIIIP